MNLMRRGIPTIFGWTVFIVIAMQFGIFDGLFGFGTTNTTLENDTMEVDCGYDGVTMTVEEITDLYNDGGFKFILNQGPSLVVDGDTLIRGSLIVEGTATKGGSSNIGGSGLLDVGDLLQT